MKKLLSASGLLALVALAACSDVAPVAPAIAVPAASSAARSLDMGAVLSTEGAVLTDEATALSEYLVQLNDELAASGSNMRYLKAELLMDGSRWDGVTSTIVLADNRYRGIGAEWVPGDPRRGERVGVNYLVQQNLLPTTRDADGKNVKLVDKVQLNAQIEEGMTAWRNQSCSAPITPLSKTDKSVDIVQRGWYDRKFFWQFASDTASANSIIGITLSQGFITPDGKFYTDIDRNGKVDLSFSQIIYNNRFYWGSNAAPNVVDFYSIITHETGHALGLGHFGKLFVTKHDTADGIQISDIKYSPYAIMNAAYVTGRNEIAGTDRSSFCQIWSAAK